MTSQNVNPTKDPVGSFPQVSERESIVGVFLSVTGADVKYHPGGAHL